MPLKTAPHLKGGTDARASQTHPGQAYFAGSGPEGKTCRQCLHWRFQGYKNDKHPRLSPCAKGTGKPFPHTALACKYFAENQNAPLPMAPQSAS